MTHCDDRQTETIVRREFLARSALGGAALLRSRGEITYSN